MAVFGVLGLLGLRLGLMVHGMKVCNLVSYMKIPSREILIPRAFFPALIEISVISDLIVCFSPASHFI